MKQLIILFIISLVCSGSYAQVLKGSGGIVISANDVKLDTAYINSRYTRILRNIASLKNISVPVTNGTIVSVLGFYDQGDGGGGKYIWSDTSIAADDGGAIISLNANPAKGRFIHEVSNGIVNLKWWGIASYNKKNPDAGSIFKKFNAAQAFLLRNPSWNSIYIPSDTSGTAAYYCSSTVTIRNSVKIYGDRFTRIEWPENTACIRIPYKDQKGIVMKTYISDLEIAQAFTRSYADSSAHGIHARSLVVLNNVRVTFCTGDAFHLEGCEVPGHPLQGTVDFSEVINCAAYQSNNGLFINGCDANKINIYKFNATAIRRWGVYDNGFLGNTYISPHFAFCGSGTNSDVVVKYKGQHYAAVSEYNFVNKGFKPDEYPQYWQEVSPMGQGIEWNPTKKYYSGGPYIIGNVNSKTTIIDPYFEGYQPDAINSIHTLSIHGTRGAGINGGADMRVTNEGLSFNTTLDIKGRHHGLHINNPTTIAGYPGVAVKSHGSFSTVYHESDKQPSVYEKYKNASNDKGIFAYDGTSFKIIPDGKLALEITPVSIRLPNVAESADSKNKMLVLDPETNEVKFTSLRTNDNTSVINEEHSSSRIRIITLINSAKQGTLRLYKNGMRLSAADFIFKGGKTVTLTKSRETSDVFIADYSLQ